MHCFNSHPCKLLQMYRICTEAAATSLHNFPFAGGVHAVITDEKEPFTCCFTGAPGCLTHQVCQCHQHAAGSVCGFTRTAGSTAACASAGSPCFALSLVAIFPVCRLEQTVVCSVTS